MTHRHLTDDDVEALALSAGRAELLEEIMSTPVRTSGPQTGSPDPDRPHRRTRWLVPLAAAAVVAGLVTVPVWLGSGGGEPETTRDPGAATSPGADPAPAGYYVVLVAPGWRVERADGGDTGQDQTTWARGGQTLDIMVKQASEYDDYVADRSDITDPPGPGQPVEVLGASSQLWAYSARDRTVIREPEAGTFVELRGEGMGEAAFLELLTGLRQVDRDGFLAAYPERLKPRPAAVQDVVDGISAALAPAHGLVPTGQRAPAFEVPEVTTPYDVGAIVAGGVACRWLAAYTDARSGGDQAGMRDAAEALGTAREWPVLREMDAEGDYPEVVWEYADETAAGADVQGFRGALGCR